MHNAQGEMHNAQCKMHKAKCQRGRARAVCAGMIFLLASPVSTDRVGAEAGAKQTFRIGSTLLPRQGPYAPLGLPAGFADPDTSPDVPWTNDEVNAPPLRLGVSRPKAWRLFLDFPGALFLAQAPDATRAAFLLTPTPTTAVLPPQGTAAELRQSGIIVARGFHRELAAVGQTKVGSQLWIWFDLGISDTARVALPGIPSLGVPSVTVLPRHHLWVFSTAVEGRQLILCFILGHADGAGSEIEKAEARRAGPTFLKILQRLTLTRQR
jgi:hypothetical protein